MNSLKNFILVLKDQMPIKRLLTNFVVTGHALGLFHRRSHYTQQGTSKVMYNTKTSATKAALSMSQKHNKHFSNYKCVFCTGYHVGKNRDNK